MTPDRDVARVALVLVSHSEALARGAAELAAQMAPGVLILAAGGMADGGLGTSFERIEQAVTRAAGDGRSVVVLADLGSAVLTTESVLELADADVASRVALVDAPFVEGAVAAAVTAHGGAPHDEVRAAAEHAGRLYGAPPEAGSAEPAADTHGGGAGSDDGVVRAHRTLLNPLGLHARPAAVVARMLAGYDAQVAVNGVNAASVLELMKLGATQGAELRVEASGPQAREAVTALTDAIDAGFGEI
ncbi:dihydroxyacetone kinase phosphoryl donor subunit DhaM [Cellulomonas sp.]|uniref:dihydroxyacetone kinase phosphoryl donor subunit DhaM n=1 Tax=Cellulomonas sp. TaxID=40001 RepID=UPI00258B6309|nr:dihydroxyacetone kinase phosphoryl donor subunit DhaM [Cellulomonas sp.]MCR6689615.1 dihydroxyacetone kinase phosphoryl donor subunit DhaM [Cellulomonas sp.]